MRRLFQPLGRANFFTEGEPSLLTTRNESGDGGTEGASLSEIDNPSSRAGIVIIDTYLGKSRWSFSEIHNHDFEDDEVA
jgi:hypothetical protein